MSCRLAIWRNFQLHGAFQRQIFQSWQKAQTGLDGFEGVGAVTKLLIENGIVTEAEFQQKLLEERVTHQRILKPTVQ